VSARPAAEAASLLTEIRNFVQMQERADRGHGERV
jgi:hypothetical protein